MKEETISKNTSVDAIKTILTERIKLEMGVHGQDLTYSVLKIDSYEHIRIFITDHPLVILENLISRVFDSPFDCGLFHRSELIEIFGFPRNISGNDLMLVMDSLLREAHHRKEIAMYYKICEHYVARRQMILNAYQDQTHG